MSQQITRTIPALCMLLPLAGPMRVDAGEPLTAKRLFAVAAPAVAMIVVQDENLQAIGTGSGFFITREGLLATNYHVIKDANTAVVICGGKRAFVVDKVVAADQDIDLAVVKVRGKRFPALSLAKGLPPIGAKVYAIGSPKGLSNSLSDGLISGYRKVDDDVFLIQTTAPISPGSSGGPLLSEDGRVIGVTTSFVIDGQNLNFAVPAALLKRLLEGDNKPEAALGLDDEGLDAKASRQLASGCAALASEDWTAALASFTALRKTMEGDHRVWLGLGLAYEGLEKYRLAAACYLRVVMLRPDSAVPHVRLAFAHRELGEFAQSIGYCRTALKRDSDCAEAYFEMSRTCAV